MTALAEPATPVSLPAWRVTDNPVWDAREYRHAAYPGYVVAESATGFKPYLEQDGALTPVSESRATLRLAVAEIREHKRLYERR